MREPIAALARHGDRAAVRTAEATLSYAELAERVRAADGALRDVGVADHDRVTLRCQPTVAGIATALALLERRCTILPLAPDAKADSLAAALAVFQPAWEIDETGARAAAARRPNSESDEPPLQALLSSGSSGTPKIVLRSAAQVQAGVRIFRTAMRIDPDDRVMLLVPLEHSFGFNSVMLGALTSGATIVLPRSRHPRGIVDDLVASGTTVFPAPPLFFDWMHRFADGAPQRLGRMRACVSVGDIVSRATFDAFVAAFGAPLWQSYGASEAGPVLLNTSGTCDGDVMALGQPYPEVEVELRDTHGGPVADGDSGEITVRSPAVGLGYLGEHDSASRIVDRVFYSGDLGVRRQGAYCFAGRTKVMITRAGRKIDPSEIERVLRSHPDVLDAAVRVAGASGHDPLQALVVARHAVAAEALIAHCARALEAHKVPRLVEFRSTLPRDGTGKLQRGRLGTW